VKFDDAVYVLDAFQKKSVKGAKTPKVDIDRVKARLKDAQEIHNERKRQRQKEQNEKRPPR
jgi:phage-related protein